MTRFVESRGGDVPDAGERGHFDGFWGDDRIPGIRAGPDGGDSEAVPGIDEGSGGRRDVPDVRGERGADKDAGDGVFGGREKGFGNRNGLSGNGVGGRVELFREDPGV